jgi:predicted DNA-binding transcriptional regulator YafY
MNEIAATILVVGIAMIGFFMMKASRRQAEPKAALPPEEAPPAAPDPVAEAVEAANRTKLVHLHDASLRLLLQYRDRDGEVTKRQVLVRTMEAHRDDGGEFKANTLHAYCYLRRAPREFRFDRIISAAEPETGEVLDDLPLWLFEQKRLLNEASRQRGAEKRRLAKKRPPTPPAPPHAGAS